MPQPRARPGYVSLRPSRPAHCLWIHWTSLLWSLQRVRASRGEARCRLGGGEPNGGCQKRRAARRGFRIPQHARLVAATRWTLWSAATGTF